MLWTRMAVFMGMVAVFMFIITPIVLCSPKWKGFLYCLVTGRHPLIIGYITRKGSALSVYGQSYIEELLKYKEL